MFLLNLPIDIKEQAAIERRRREEKERLSRIFNVKYRTIGVKLKYLILSIKSFLNTIQIDKEGLDEQIRERQYIKQFEKQRNDVFGKRRKFYEDHF